ncbi:MAG: hypothetical protein U9O50_03760 [Acidobacteriota bacterium]|nr:hypothetical protein [Acidobacteriota bacterium]
MKRIEIATPLTGLAMTGKESRKSGRDEIATPLTGLAMTIRKESFAMTKKRGAF